MEISKRELIDLVHKVYRSGYTDGVVRTPQYLPRKQESDMNWCWVGSDALLHTRRVLKGELK